jgi:hypothetical protein
MRGCNALPATKQHPLAMRGCNALPLKRLDLPRHYPLRIGSRTAPRHSADVIREEELASWRQPQKRRQAALLTLLSETVQPFEHLRTPIWSCCWNQ